MMTVFCIFWTDTPEGVHETLDKVVYIGVLREALKRLQPSYKNFLAMKHRSQQVTWKKVLNWPAAKAQND